MTINDLNDLQRYLVEEEAEKWRDGLIGRRDFMHRVTLLVGGVAAGGVLLSLGCDVSAPEPTPTAPAATAILPATQAQATAQAGNQGSTSPYHVDEKDPSIHV